MSAREVVLMPCAPAVKQWQWHTTFGVLLPPERDPSESQQLYPPGWHPPSGLSGLSHMWLVVFRLLRTALNTAQYKIVSLPQTFLAIAF